MFMDRTARIPRLWSNRELQRIAPLFTGDVVNVSGWEDRDKNGGHYRDYFTSATGYFLTNYSGERGLQQLPNEYFLDLEDEVPSELRHRFDVVFNHTTLEHVFEVRKAFRTLCDLSKDLVIVVVPFAQSQHETPTYGDFWRFTPTCLRRLFEENGLRAVYESENRHRNAGTYLFFVGSRNPERWAERMPKYVPLERSASWIGRTPVRDVVRRVLTGAWGRLQRSRNPAAGSETPEAS